MHKSLSKTQLISFYKEMLLYRRFEEKVNVAYTQQKFSGFCHLHIGQEGVCVGIQACLKASDYVVASYRSHTQALAKGITPQQVMSELFGKVSGCSRGKGGSMHLFSNKMRFFGGQGIVGSQVPVATGVGFAIKYNNQQDIVVCYLGDAAFNQGQVFESLNMAAIWSLPVLFVVENNKYGMGTAIERVAFADKFQERAAAFGVHASQVDGMNVTKVYNHIMPIVGKMRSAPKPYFVEVKTYRYKGHSVSDPGNYRSKDEIDQYRQQDCITTLGDELVAKKIASSEEIALWDKAIKQNLKEVVHNADMSPQPETNETWHHVYAD